MGAAANVKLVERNDDSKRKRGPNKEKPREFSIVKTGDEYTLSVAGVEIPLADLDTIKTVVWSAVMKGGLTQVSFKAE